MSENLYTLEDKMFLIFTVSIFLTALATPALTSKRDEFNEEVLIRSLPTGVVLASFAFTTKSAVPRDGPSRHFDLLPKFVGEIIDDNGVFELDSELTRGVWRSKFWGYPPRPTATGARVAAFFKPGYT